MEIAVLGLNHNTAPVGLREKVAFSPERLRDGLKQMKQELALSESLILSTCNRVELYCAVPEVNGHRGKLAQFVNQFHSLKLPLPEKTLYWHAQPESIKHLFKVASGLDSMVLGESEILGQVKDAYGQATDVGTVGPALHRLMHQTFSVAKEVRTKTKIGRGAISVSSVAVELAKKIFSDLKMKCVLILGAGEMGEAALRCLVDRGVKNVLVSNRSFDNAQGLAARVGGRAVATDNLMKALQSSDILICSAGADRYLLTRTQVQTLMRLRRQRPFFLIDISVPRNLDPTIGSVDNVYLYNIDDLQGIAASNLKRRSGEMNDCLSIINKGSHRYMDWLTSRSSGSV